MDTGHRDRKCVDCGREISLCNGFVMSNHFVEMLEGKRDVKDVGEICGRCVLIRDMEIGSPETT